MEEDRMNRSKLNVYSFTTGIVSVMMASAVLAASPADKYPEKPVRVVIPAPAGGPTEVIGRVIFTKMAESMGQPFVLETKPGASGTIGAADVAKAPADGYALLTNASWHVLYPGIFKELRFDPMNDFRMVGLTGTVPMVAVVSASSPYKLFAEVVTASRRSPGSVTYAHPGSASLPYLVGQFVNQQGQLTTRDIAYKGTGPALTDVAGGHVDMMYAPLPPAMPMIQSGKLRALAVSTGSRLKELPDVPTIAESGFPGFDVVTWYGVWAPKNTPTPIVEKLNKALVDASKTPQVLEVLKGQGTMPSDMTASQAEAYAKAEHVKWMDVLKKAGIKPE
jgi:tripartite-type tricarboxylate transporter receptor subunit TctC